MIPGAHIRMDDRYVSPSLLLETVGPAVPVVIITGELLRSLEREKRGYRKTTRYLVKLAESWQQPIILNAPTGDGNSQSVVIGPRSWDRERLSGWLARNRPQIEEALGPMARMDWGPR